MLALSGLFVYPLKGARGISLSEASVEPCGLAHDRRWMVVDSEGVFISQRTKPQLATLQAVPDDENHLRLIFADGASVTAATPGGDESCRVSVWSSKVKAAPANNEANAALSDFLGQQATLVAMTEITQRRVDTRYGTSADRVSFADGYPLLAITESALEALNARLEAPAPMDRFRPNVVIADADAHDEDTWARFTIGGVPFAGVKPCSRCQVVAIDQTTGTPGKEPLRTLATYRKARGRVYFGQNLIPRGEGVIRVGDAIKVLERKRSPLP